VYASGFLTGGTTLVTVGPWDNDPAIAAAGRVAGAFALRTGSRDSAVLLTLEPGAYTAQLSSATNASGNAMIEIYVVDF
jgi:hypothetical protein